MEDPSYITKPPKRGHGRQDGPGTRQGVPAGGGAQTPTSGTTTDARLASENIDLGGVAKKAIGSLFAKGGFLNRRRGGAKLKYPLHNELNHPAKIKFTAYKAKAYTIDPKAIAEIWDVPLLGWGDDKSRTLKEGREKEEQKKNRVATASGYDGVDDFGNQLEPNPRTVTVGGSNQGGSRGNMQSTLEGYRKDKEQEAKDDAIKGANIP